MPENRLEAVKRMLTRPYGLVLVTGPTGSGKTTTLYSGLELLRNSERNIVTVEDPVEYQLDLVNQIQANDPVGLTFARALRSILRQDPDIIMVGEIRDPETARVAIQAALTGHLVLSTLHTNDSPGAVTRLVDMGVEPFLIASSLVGVIAQRLARTICPACRRPYLPPKALLDEAGWPMDERQPKNFFQGEGCRQCHDSGYRGRRGVYEVLEVDAQLRELIHDEADESRIRSYLRSTAWLDLRSEGLFLVRDGASTLEEVMRVTHLERDDSRKSAEAGDAASASPSAGSAAREALLTDAEMRRA
jgi:type IV pilus assembly protein PilB